MAGSTNLEQSQAYSPGFRAAYLLGNLGKIKMKEMFRSGGLGLSTALSTGSVD
jgi:hypothetical protein